MSARIPTRAWPWATALALVALASACVKGSPLDDEQLGTFAGGAVTPVGCSYQSVTRVGAEAPALSTAEVGVDPSIRHVHLGFVGDPRSSMVVTWRTRDDATLARIVAPHDTLRCNLRRAMRTRRRHVAHEIAEHAVRDGICAATADDVESAHERRPVSVEQLGERNSLEAMIVVRQYRHSAER